MTEVQGHCDPRFAEVRDLLTRNCRTGRELGASLHVDIDGETVVDLWGGWRDRGREKAWDEDTIVNVFSSSKTVASLAVLMLHDRGVLDIFAPVAAVWPEFARNGKERLEVRHVLSHGAGLPGWERPFTLDDVFDHAGAAARLAAQAPWWEPGTRCCYHPSTFGTLVGEIVWRATGRTLGAFIAEDIAGPTGADYHLGLGDAELPRVSDVVEAARRLPALRAAYERREESDPGFDAARRIGMRTQETNISSLTDDTDALFNSGRWRRAEFGGSNGHTNARGLGRIISALSLDGVSRGVRLLSPRTISLIFREQYHGTDGYFLRPIRWGIGYALGPSGPGEKGVLPFLRPSRRTCFWFGRGGSFAIADLDRRITLTYAMNQCRTGRDSPNGDYYDAVYRSFGL